LLANLFMHYAFDAWMCRMHPNLLASGPALPVNARTRLSFA
jgi:hypothetical protein